MEELTTEAVRNWVSVATGEFHFTKVLDGSIDPILNNRLRKIMHDLCGEGLIEPIGKRDGMYRPIENWAKPLDWQGIGATLDSGIVLPFELRKYVFLYPDTVTVVAGSKSSGKTGFIYRTIALNMNKVHTVLLTNLEGGTGQLRDRFDAMDIKIPTPAPFDVIPVYANFHDYIKKPDTLYCVDYIDAPDGTEFYLIGGLISKISNKLQGLNSNAVIGLQKPMGRDNAFGGEQTLRSASLYIALDSNKLKIVDAKVPADKTIHPKNMQWTFIYQDEGTRFDNIQRSYDV